LFQFSVCSSLSGLVFQVTTVIPGKRYGKSYFENILLYDNDIHCISCFDDYRCSIWHVHYGEGSQLMCIIIHCPASVPSDIIPPMSRKWEEEDTAIMRYVHTIKVLCTVPDEA
ncbi:unnamed protein product, partial [Ixodes hexagonus]